MKYELLGALAAIMKHYLINLANYLTLLSVYIRFISQSKLYYYLFNSSLLYRYISDDISFKLDSAAPWMDSSLIIYW